MENIMLFDLIWNRIVENEENEFLLKQGKSFHYKVTGNVIKPDTVNRNIPRSEIEKAIRLAPFNLTTILQDLQAPSYIYSILMDERICGRLW